MAAASGAARLCRLACQRTRITQNGWQNSTHRSLSTSASRWARERRSKAGGNEKLELKRLEEAFAKSTTPEGLRQLDELAKSNGFNTIDEYLTTTLNTTPGWSSEDRSLEDDLRSISTGSKPIKESFWFDSDDPEMDTGDHDVFNEDDITSMAHGKLDEVREMRHYARLSVWEMPLLSKFAKPFEPPGDDQVLRWRYTTYMGEHHPAEKKVVVQFAPDDLKLTPVQTEKLKKLAGARYNPESELIKMSCESFEHQAQNKRYLSNLVDDLITAAKDPKDTFQDVPLDVRHHRFNDKPRFPKGWRMSEERRLEIEAYRQRAAEQDQAKAEAGTLVHGQQLIDQSSMQGMLSEPEPKEKEKVAELVAARSLKSSGKTARPRR